MIELRWLKVPTPFHHPQNATVSNVLGQNMILQMRQGVKNLNSESDAFGTMGWTEWADIPVVEEE